MAYQNVLSLREAERGGYSANAGSPTSAGSRAETPSLEWDAQDQRPLVVDLDGTLIRSDLLIEAFFGELGRNLGSLPNLALALLQGKAAFKHRLSAAEHMDPATLPYDTAVLERIHQARAIGRRVYLASASHENLVQAVADHLGLFDGWFATNLDGNCAGEVKAARLVEAFGEGGFDYIGNDAADLPVWRHAGVALAVRTPVGVARRLKVVKPDASHLAHDRPGWTSWLKLLRVHQYAKNALVFVPLLTGHVFNLLALSQTVLAAIAFCLCASSVYILNDLVDLRDDRNHPTKSARPLASGQIPLAHALLAAPVLLLTALIVAAFISLPFVGVLVAYYALTTAYSFYLKRKMLADVITLACLYTVRVVGGAAAIGTGISVWLIAFFMAWFLSLALIKRCVELVGRRNAKLPDASSRDYKQGDIQMVSALAAASGFNAITIFALYASSDLARDFYQRAEILWLVTPLLTYWIARALMLANRGKMHDDPVVFALKDRVSLGTIGAAVALILVAM